MHGCCLKKAHEKRTKKIPAIRYVSASVIVMADTVSCDSFPTEVATRLSSSQHKIFFASLLRVSGRLRITMSCSSIVIILQIKGSTFKLIAPLPLYMM